MLNHLAVFFFAAPLLSFISISFSCLTLGIVYLFIRFSVLVVFILLKPILKDSYLEAADKYFDRVEQKTKIFINDNDILLFIIIIFYLYNLLTFYTSLPSVYSF
jgi:hypothetical protein